MKHPSADKLRYASVLEWGARVGFGVLAASFLAYVTRMLPAYVPLERLPTLWKLSAQSFVRETGVPTGWRWLSFLSRGEFASLAGISILAGSSLLCLGVVMVLYARRGERAHAAICAATIVVLLLAASGATTPGP